jgi:ribosome-associated protein
MADDLKAENLVVLDVRGLCDVADFFVIATAANRRQMRAIQRRIAGEFRQPPDGPARIEGDADSPWILLDLDDVVVHVFDPEGREFYDLELLWGDAKRVGWQGSPTAKR